MSRSRSEKAPERNRIFSCLSSTHRVSVVHIVRERMLSRNVLLSSYTGSKTNNDRGKTKTNTTTTTTTTSTTKTTTTTTTTTPMRERDNAGKHVRRGSLLCLVFGRMFVCVWFDCRRCFVRVGRGDEICQTGQRKAIHELSSRR